jgi:hypothetical protein
VLTRPSITTSVEAILLDTGHHVLIADVSLVGPLSQLAIAVLNQRYVIEIAVYPALRNA